MDTRTGDAGHERSATRQAVSACADLIACVVEGAIARKENIDRAQNPCLAALADDTMTSFERNRRLCLAEAWWDGWDELNLVLRAAAAS